MFRMQVWNEGSRVYQDVRVRGDHLGAQGFDVAQPGVPATEYDSPHALQRDKDDLQDEKHVFCGIDTSSGKRFFDNADFPPQWETEEGGSHENA
ncbi:hypothetical protein [Polaromonas sp. JS666]|uniref:hypothetical protein n=1 Tax=Polaromonas sp. (strain JS666 / ATCC BAA-500) TaxID=296591 RepID=UPI0000D5B4A8|nr:hypothetical protein [Polaromonas sp. JS666]ABE47241.1 hypothetical protein Bpro_5387 [Polaromonas sp. JS666]